MSIFVKLCPYSKQYLAIAYQLQDVLDEVYVFTWLCFALHIFYHNCYQKFFRCLIYLCRCQKRFCLLRHICREYLQQHACNHSCTKSQPCCPYQLSRPSFAFFIGCFTVPRSLFLKVVLRCF